MVYLVATMWSNDTNTIDLLKVTSVVGSRPVFEIVTNCQYLLLETHKHFIAVFAAEILLRSFLLVKYTMEII